MHVLVTLVPVRLCFLLANLVIYVVFRTEYTPQVMCHMIRTQFKHLIHTPCMENNKMP